jgi:hypothetical protein
MHPLLRTLDSSANAGTESSALVLHPIRDAASGRSRGLPLLLSLGLTPLLIYGLSISLISPSSIRVIQGVVDQTRRSVTLLLHEPGASVIQAPARLLLGPKGPGGAGHREGTNTLDPRLVAHTSIFSKPSDAMDPDELSVAPKAERVNLSLNPALPLQAGGNGLARGTGRDSALGNGGLARPGLGPDFKLIPTKQVPLQHRLGPDESDRGETVRVRLIVGDDGVPTQAFFVSGPVFLQEKAIKTALEWRYEPLAPHGLKAPLPVNLIFHPVLQSARGAAAQANSPLPIQQVAIAHRLRPGEASSNEPSVVRILIGANGVPTQARVLSGPPNLNADAMKAALEWRFEPLGNRGLKAPYPYTIIFNDTPQRR